MGRHFDALIAGATVGLLAACAASTPPTPREPTVRIAALCLPERFDDGCLQPAQTAVSLRKAGVTGTMFGVDPPSSLCAALAARARPTAILERKGKCILTCDRGELGGYAGIYDPNATNSKQGECVGLHGATAFVELKGETLVFARDFFSCGGSVGRLVEARDGWEVQPIGDLDGEPLSYVREDGALIVELACTGHSDTKVDEWQRRSRVRVTTRTIQRL